MERLTEYRNGEPRPKWLSVSQVEQRKVVEKLAYYEDAEEQGRLFVIPCKAGDAFFYNFLNKTYEGKLIKVVYYGAGTQAYFSDYGRDNASLPLTELYSSRAEAEAALEKTKEG